MDFCETCEFFGGSMFHDDWPGNFQQAEINLKVREGTVNAADPNEKACLQHLRATWHLLTGDFKRADQGFETLQSDAPSARWRLRASVYRPAFRSWEQAEVEHDLCQVWIRSNECEQMLIGEDVTTTDKLKLNIIKTTCAIDMHIGELSRYLPHKSRDFYRGRAAPGEHHVAVTHRLVTMLATLSRLTSGHLPAVSVYLELQTYFLEHAAGIPTAWEKLQRVEALCQAAEDNGGLDLYWLTRADYNLSPAFLSPRVPNLEIVGCIEEYGGDSSMRQQDRLYSLVVMQASAENMKPI
ncbi:hypothetical protein LTR49_026893 [Elasticomyces elasticus]|nr:hypothetical protein LTR49_026893 [Elasticomyces elasticus]